MAQAPKRRITFKVDYPEEDLVGLVFEGEGKFRQVERGYLIADEDGAVRFVPEFDRKSKEKE